MYTIAPLQGIPNAVSGVITSGAAGIALDISLPLGVAVVVAPIVIPAGDVSTIFIGPPLTSAPKILPGLSLSSMLKSTKNTADPAQESFLLIPPPIIATYLSVLMPPDLTAPVSVTSGILTILGVDQVSPN